jgi:ABC-type multidrug transport system ATPase subunit
MIRGMQSCIEVSAIAYAHGTRTTLAGVDLMVAPGQVHGVLGPRWAGKTTLLRILAGELEPSCGDVRVAGRIVLVGDDGRSPIEERLDPATRRRVSLARAIASAPDVLLVDEPAEGFDDDTTAATRSLVRRYIAHGGAAVWATRRLDALTGIATDVTLLADGRVRYRGTAEALSERSLPGLVSRLRRVA